MTHGQEKKDLKLTFTQNNMEDKLLKKFIKEHFPFAPLLKAGFFKKEMRNNYPMQAKRVCEYFWFSSIYEYGATEIRCHMNTTESSLKINQSGKLVKEPFITVFKSIYE